MGLGRGNRTKKKENTTGVSKLHFEKLEILTRLTAVSVCLTHTGTK